MARGAAGQPIPVIPAATRIPRLHLPESRVFSVRAARLRSLAEGHAMGDFLRFMAEIAIAQQRVLDDWPDHAMTAREGWPVPLAFDRLSRDPAWQQGLRCIVDAVAAKAPEPYGASLNRHLALATAEDAERWAQAYLTGTERHDEIDLMPMIGAALQVYWVSMARQLQAEAVVGNSAAGNLCPVCGALPAGGIIRAGAASQGLRYLECSLCASQWHMERIRCVSCGDGAQVSCYGIEGMDGAVQAEACDACHTYTKLMHMEKAPAVDVIADDLATLSLDMLIGEAGYRRFGRNPFILDGAAV